MPFLPGNAFISIPTILLLFLGPFVAANTRVPASRNSSCAKSAILGMLSLWTIRNRSLTELKEILGVAGARIKSATSLGGVS